MKTWMVTLCSLALSGQAVADTLVERLAELNNFNAHFEQKVFSYDGTLVQTAAGELHLSKPGKFVWHTQQPDEQLMVSDGQTLWLYNPLLEQVTLYDAAQMLGATPLALLLGDPQAWQGYNIEDTERGYRVTPREASTELSAFELAFNGDQLSQLVVLDTQGQQMQFSFSKQDTAAIAPDRFQLTLPDGVDIDDQRAQ